MISIIKTADPIHGTPPSALFELICSEESDVANLPTRTNYANVTGTIEPRVGSTCLFRPDDESTETSVYILCGDGKWRKL